MPKNFQADFEVTPMHKIRIAVVALAVIATACGGSESADSRPRTTGPLTTTVAPTDSSTSAAPETTATTAAPATTADSPGAGVPGGLAAVQAAMERASVEPPSHIEGLMEISGVDPTVGRLDISIPFSMAQDSLTGDSHMSMDFSGMADMIADTEMPPGFADMFGEFEVRQIGDTAYIKFGFLNMMFGAETEWMAMPVDDGEGFTEGFTSGINPYDSSSFLGGLSDSAGELTVVGRETIHGTATTHYQLLFDLESLAKLDPDAYREMQGMAPLPVQYLPMDFWLDDQERIRRYTFEIDGSDIADFGGSDEFDYMRLQFDFSEYGGRVTVEPPPADQVTHVDDLEGFAGFGDV